MHAAHRTAGAFAVDGHELLEGLVPLDGFRGGAGDCDRTNEALSALARQGAGRAARVWVALEACAGTHSAAVCDGKCDSKIWR